MKHSVTFGLVPSSSNTRPVRARVSWAGLRLDVRLGVSYDADKWVDGRPKRSTKSGNGVTAAEVSRLCSSFAQEADVFFDAYAATRGGVPSVDEVREALDHSTRSQSKKRGKMTAAESIEAFVRSEGRLNSWSDSTYKKFATLRVHLDKWRKDVALSELTRERLEEFVAFLHVEGLRNTTVSKYCGLVRWWLGWCEERGMAEAGLASSLRPKMKGTEAGLNDIVYLEREELASVMGAEVSPSVAKVRDIFLLQCFTGLRYSDVRRLRREDVGEDALRIVTEKTADALVIELNAQSRAILARFDFVVPSNQVYNRELKVLGKAAGLTRVYTLTHYDGARRIVERRTLSDLLTTHVARRTFVVLALTLGIPSEVVRSWTGHKSEASMRPYYKIVDSAKAAAMARFDILDPKKQPEKDGDL